MENYKVLFWLIGQTFRLLKDPLRLKIQMKSSKNECHKVKIDSFHFDRTDPSNYNLISSWTKILNKTFPIIQNFSNAVYFQKLILGKA